MTLLPKAEQLTPDAKGLRHGLGLAFSPPRLALGLLLEVACTA
jgi:hypothetical protein